MEYTKYKRVDRAHNVWRCTGCGHLEKLEEDGPYENGWDFCPHCGRPIHRTGMQIQEAEGPGDQA